ncbi:hypothetical protein QBZ16_004168 [Prototheca wickerhamii]|uniref:G8 domain-containing protein n=1 Tax=Prototheca wickerhamii TaxID=3111 RepID=A0AAD9MHB4_PROWI|nr:hypothetical protein QBZ16_004168 [Prototheca wickerhamii]
MINQNATYTQIVIPASSELVIDDNTIVWNLGSIDVYGKLTAGSETCRLQSRITFQFRIANGISTFAFGIRVRPGGTINMHGIRYNPTWTRLASTLEVGTTSIKLQDAVDWQPGQQIFVTTTIWRDLIDNQNEVFTITAVSADGKTVTVAESAQNMHYGGQEYQAEVGLLSRNILVTGETAMDTHKLGAHIRVEGSGRISGTQIVRGGQYNVMGAYPFHFHMIGDGSGMYFADNSVYKSYFRCYVVHGTNNTVVQRNTAFDNWGHCYYLEDGVEELNTIQHNLAALVRVMGTPSSGVDQSGTTTATSSSGLENPSDNSASGFYVTNPRNSIVGNAASGGYSGFFYPVLPAPLGLNRAVPLVPSTRPMLLFDGNSAHSSGYFWENAGCIYFGGKIYYVGNDLTYNSGRNEFDTRSLDGSPAFMEFSNVKTFLCMSGHMSWGARMELRNYTAHDVVRGATMFGDALLQGAHIQYASSNPASQFPGDIGDLPPAAGFQWYDTSTQTLIVDTTFANYSYQPDLGNFRPSCFYSMTHSDQYKPLYMSVAKNISYVDVDYDAIIRLDVKQTGSSRMFNFLDWDGSATLSTGPQIVGGWPTWWDLAPDCFYQNNWNTWTCPQRDAQVPARLDVRIPGTTIQWGTGASADPTPANYIGYVAQFGHQGDEARSMVITRNEGITGVTGITGWYAHLNSGAPSQLQIFLTQVPKGTSIIWAMRYPSGTRFTIKREYKYYANNNRDIPAASSLNALVNDAESTYFFDGTYLYIKVLDPGDAETENAAFIRAGIYLPGSRYFSGWYSVSTNLGSSWTPLSSMSNEIPPAVGTVGAPLATAWVPAGFTGETPSPSPPAGGPPPPGCSDVPPSPDYTCAQQAAFGKCSAVWMVEGDYCAQTCGRCLIPTPSTDCGDVSPVPDVACEAYVAIGACELAWMRQNRYCSESCGFCIPIITLPPLQGWGKCDESWMISGNYCAQTCGRCGSTACTDAPTPDGYTCAQQQGWGKCNEPWMLSGDYCAQTCGRCGTPSPPPACSDVQPPGIFTCEQQKAWGQCSTLWMVFGGFCEATCGRCAGINSVTDAESLVPEGESLATVDSVEDTPLEEDASSSEVMPSETWAVTGTGEEALRVVTVDSVEDVPLDENALTSEVMPSETWEATGREEEPEAAEQQAPLAEPTTDEEEALPAVGLLLGVPEDEGQASINSLEQALVSETPTETATINSENLSCPPDIVPPDMTCEEVKYLGLCFSLDISQGGYCTRTCGFCAPAPPPATSLEITIDTAEPSPSPSVVLPQSVVNSFAPGCADLPPPGAVSCAAYMTYSSCDSDILSTGEYCALTCNRCVVTSAVAPLAGPMVSPNPAGRKLLVGARSQRR